MDTAKASINLVEGIIQLEGTEQFVKTYLDKYEPLITNWQNAAKRDIVSEPQKKALSEASPKKKRQRATKGSAGPTCTESIQKIADEGFFKGQQRSRANVQEELIKRGLNYKSSLVSAVLNNMFDSNRLLKTGVGKNAKYYTNA